MKIGVLTSSRADFGVYLPLLHAFRADADIDFDLIVFGTHLSFFHGYTVDEIQSEGFEIAHKIETTMVSDTPEAISTSAALTSLKFASFWSNHYKCYDYVLCLGDRYEMFAAVISGVPFNIKFVHFYGGNHSAGAIDNVYRNAMTHIATLHFPATDKCAQRVLEMTHANKKDVMPVGILSLDGLEQLELYSVQEFFDHWGIDLNKPTILVTFHPETINPQNNKQYVPVIEDVLSKLQPMYQFVISMPNADTSGQIYRTTFEKLKTHFPERIFLIDNFGAKYYFTSLKYAKMLLGNTSSGISEAASFKKYVINVGKRQEGREVGHNVISVAFDKKLILNAVTKIEALGDYKGKNIYRREYAVLNIIHKLKAYST